MEIECRTISPHLYIICKTQVYILVFDRLCPTSMTHYLCTLVYRPRAVLASQRYSLIVRRLAHVLSLGTCPALSSARYDKGRFPSSHSLKLVVWWGLSRATRSTAPIESTNHCTLITHHSILVIDKIKQLLPKSKQACRCLCPVYIRFGGSSQRMDGCSCLATPFIRHLRNAVAAFLGRWRDPLAGASDSYSYPWERISRERINRPSPPPLLSSLLSSPAPMAEANITTTALSPRPSRPIRVYSL
jgi:hypothetical protein